MSKRFNHHIPLFFLVTCFINISPSVYATELSPKKLSPKKLWPFAYTQTVTLCEFEKPRTAIPNFTEKQCRTASLHEIDPQNTSLWVKLIFHLPEDMNKLSPPYGLFIFGKAASAVYLNGQLLGKNGQPAFDRSELPGRIDTTFYIPESQLKDKNNQMVMHLSAQHSLVNLNHPIHSIGLGAYTDAKRFIQRFRFLGLVLLGAFLIGALYFSTSSYLSNSSYFSTLSTRNDKKPDDASALNYRLFAAMCFIAALQLGAEISRSVVSYLYPWHDIRLISVTGLSFTFGMLILSYSSFKLANKRAIHWMYAGVMISVLSIILIPSFDGKTTAAIFIPMLISTLQLFINWRKKPNKNTLIWFFAQTITLIIISFTGSAFHEILYFLLIGIFLVYLFIQQAREYQKQHRRTQYDQALIAKLELKLAQNKEIRSPAKLSITIAGKTELIAINDIAYCRAAGDYVELHLIKGDEKLFSGSMKELETRLPDTFLRIHRSYLVNINEVQSLVRTPSNQSFTHCLQLCNGLTVPVSRRLLSTVKGLLGSADSAYSPSTCK